VFRNDSLADIAEEFNRYNRTLQMRVEGAEASDRRLSGVFDADAPESLLRFLGVEWRSVCRTSGKYRGHSSAPGALRRGLTELKGHCAYALNARYIVLERMPEGTPVVTTAQAHADLEAGRTTGWMLIVP
jgi:hypothetical protein